MEQQFRRTPSPLASSSKDARISIPDSENSGPGRKHDLSNQERIDIEPVTVRGRFKGGMGVDKEKDLQPS